MGCWQWCSYQTVHFRVYWPGAKQNSTPTPRGPWPGAKQNSTSTQRGPVARDQAKFHFHTKGARGQGPSKTPLPHKGGPWPGTKQNSTYLHTQNTTYTNEHWGFSVKYMNVTQLVVLTHETCTVLCILQTMDCTCMLIYTITCAKQVKIWPIPWHRVAYNFMHIATKMHHRPVSVVWEYWKYTSIIHQWPVSAVWEYWHYTSIIHQRPVSAVWEYWKYASIIHQRPVNAVWEYWKYTSIIHQWPVSVV